MIRVAFDPFSPRTLGAAPAPAPAASTVPETVSAVGTAVGNVLVRSIAVPLLGFFALGVGIGATIAIVAGYVAVKQSR